MNAELISIGNEILSGQTINTNAAWIAEKLTLLGIPVHQITTITDHTAHILKALDDAAAHVDLIIVTGGLGPTKDDITKEAIYQFFSATPVFDEDIFKDVQQHFTSRGMPTPEINRSQAEIPKGSRIFRNRQGTAPGIWIEKDHKVFIFLPGVPYEMKDMMEREILPALKQQFPLPPIIYRTVLTQGITESLLAELISDWEESLQKENISLAYLPSPGIVKLRLFAAGENTKLLRNKIEQKIRELEKLIPDYIFGFDGDRLEELVGHLLRKNKKTLATAESCTGGHTAHLITAVPGSSDYFTGSIIAYSNEAKISLLRVNKNTLNQYGAVSRQVVEELVLGAKKELNTDCAIAISGIAGPTGGSPEKPVGTVWIAVATPDQLISKKFSFGHDRLRNIHKSSLMALDMLRRILT